MTTIETVAGFCDRHGACAEGREWALANCASMADVFDKCERGDWLIWAIRRSGVEIDKAAWVRFAVAFARRALPRFERRNATDKRTRKAIEAADAWLSNPCETTKAAASAYAAASAAAYAAAAASSAAAYAAAADAAYARKSERKWQADELRKVIVNPWRTA